MAGIYHARDPRLCSESARVTLAEAAIVLASRAGADPARHLDGFVDRAGLVVVPFDALHRRTVTDAWLRFGRGRRPAALNLGDCLIYATARVAGRPLLAKGADFRRTDLPLA